MRKSQKNIKIAVIGAGPAGLMAAEVLSAQGYNVDIFERMPTPARKFLMAGKSGLNITHNEAFDTFLSRYFEARPQLQEPIKAHSPTDIQNWMQSLGSDYFVGSSGRIFPKVMKASPLLRAWIKRLESYDARLFTRHEWNGWDDDNTLLFKTPEGAKTFQYDVTVLALGGISWPKLGNNNAWSKHLTKQGIKLIDFKPANCGFDVVWSPHIKEKFAGIPIKNIRLSITANEQVHQTQGDMMITKTGIEGGPVYTLSRFARDILLTGKKAFLEIDLTPDKSIDTLTKSLVKSRGKKSLSTHLKRSAGISGAKAALLRECTPKEIFQEANIYGLAAAIKSLKLELHQPRPIEEAISSAGGICFSNFDRNLMIKSKPGLFCAGEMINWEAPTGGYLITACLAQGKQVADGVMDWIQKK
jgi:uncharacterized flavoprotein (TIGR03862 family)